MKELKQLVPTIIVLILMSAPVDADDFEDGRSAYFLKDYKTALEKWKRAAEKKSRSYLQTEAVFVDEKGAAKKLALSTQATPGAAENNVGYLYSHGLGVTQNHEEANKWYRRAAGKNSAEAQNNLGWQFQEGNGVLQSYKGAIKWYELSVLQGYDIARVNLAYLYFWGEGVPRDYMKAAKLYHSAAKNGNGTAQASLGVMYNKAWGVEQNYEEAIKWLKLASNQGSSSSQFLLGVMYAKGQGVIQSYKEAAKYYSLATKAEGVYASFSANNLAELYKEGKGVTKNFKKAAELFKAIAHVKHWAIHFNLGEIYRDGLGVQKDLLKANLHFTLSVKFGGEEAIKEVEALNKNLSQNENSKVKFLVREWIAQFWPEEN